MRGLVLAALALAMLATAAPGLADVKISDRPYVRHDGGSDMTIADCSVNNRQQNEPAAAVAPHDAMLMTAGANDYCPVPTSGDTWAGFYYSSDGGDSWTNSLLPGYSTDTSAEGQASPLFRFVSAAGDPVQAWDNFGHLYYAGIAFNRTKPANGSIWAARYDWQAGPAPDYRYTTIVSRGTPSPIFLGRFEDKVMIEVDRGAASPHSGNIYICWTRFTASGANNSVYLATSTDAARSFKVQKVSESVHGSQFCDIAVTRNGTVFVAWRQFAFRPEQGQLQDNAVVFVKSTNGGNQFTKPRVVNEFIGWDPGDEAANPAAFGRARFEACQRADLTPGACASPEPQQETRDCGDGPLACASGFVFHRANSQVRITADPTAAGNPNAAYIVYDGTVPGTLTPTGTTYGTVGSGTGSQASVYFVKTTNGGASWTAAARIDSQAVGHQYFPDIDANSGRLHAVWQDSRDDCASGPPSTPSGGDFRTAPVSNRWVPSNPPGGENCEPGGPGSDTAGLHAVYASSANDGVSWSTEIVSTVLTMPQYEQFGDRDVPFFGDYNYISASGTTVLMDWTDQRDTVPGTDPRYPVDGTDGFDVFQTRACTGTPPACGPDTTPGAGGLDQNIYGAVID
jgi:hypothetical protein